MSSNSSGSATVSTVLLDLDGVLMDHDRAAHEAVRDWLGERATPEVVAAWFAAQDRHLAAWRNGVETWQEQRRGRLRDLLRVLGEPVPDDGALDESWSTAYGAAYRRSWCGFADAAPALASLRATGVRLAVLTNGAEEQQNAKLAAVGLTDAIERVFTAEGIGARKPDPRAFLLACEALHVVPIEVLYVGDEHEVDVLGARGAGMRAVLLDRNGTAPPEERSVIRSLSELPGLVDDRCATIHPAPGRLGS